MSAAHELLRAARAAGVIVEAAGDKLKLRAKTAPPADLLAALREHKPELLAVLAIHGPEEYSGHWLISMPPERLERWFSPAVTRAELEQRCPGAVLIALPESLSDPRPPTEEEAAELRRLVTAVAAQEAFSEEEKAEALGNALRDSVNALRCFRALLNC